MRITTLVENRPSPDDPQLVAGWHRHHRDRRRDPLAPPLRSRWRPAQVPRTERSRTGLPGGRIGGHRPRPSGNKALFLREGDTLAVLTACSHNGLLNMVETVAGAFPGVPIKAVVGGFHLAALPPFRGMSESATTVAGIGQSVLDIGVETTWTGHCTGTKALAVLHSTMGDRVREIHTGSRLEL